MKYQPITCVWEVTMGCNMRCGHCGSSCAEPLPDEFNTTEALEVCDQLANIGLKWITLSGGEPLTRKDLPLIIKRLSEKGISVNIITNGWLLRKDMAGELKRSGVTTIAISIDGTKELHDMIRRKGAFDHAEEAFALMKQLGIKTGAVTTITKQNIDVLGELKEELIRMGVDTWQVQLGLPMGNLKERPEWLLEPERMKDIIDFCYETAKEGRIKIYPADCIGYYTKKELEIKKISYGTDLVSVWDGCNAGIRGFGILQNGDVLGCTSIRDRQYVEGNLRERSLRAIWEDKSSFLWRRNMTKTDLSGNCRSCTYGSKCLGGCPNTRLTMNGDIYSDNQYCAYNLAMKKMEAKYENYDRPGELFLLGDSMIKQKEYGEAVFALSKAAEFDPENVQVLKAKGYAEYMCGNYENCRRDNEAALKLDEEDAYALRGFAIAVYRMGNRAEGLEKMRKAVALTSCKDMDLMEDLRAMENS